MCHEYEKLEAKNFSRENGRKNYIYIYIWEGKESLKFDSGEEIKPCTEYTYLGTIIDQLGDNTTDIKHRINQARKAINALNLVWWQKKFLKTENYTFVEL